MSKKIGRPKDPNAWSKKICKCCGIEFEARRCYTKRGQMAYCSNACGKAHNGELNGRWKGGRLLTFQGYVRVYSPKHPNRDYKNQVFEHRLVMEKEIGRYLGPEEVVHHINEIKTDNRIENLMLFRIEADHQRHHAKIRKHNNTL